jgi:8-oxo-dGTP pyrophosphatase MutT (NUDIX family)
MTIRLAAAIVVHDDKVLIVRRSRREGFLPEVWGLPCGKIDTDTGEHPRQAVLRELREETGLCGRVLCYVGRSSFVSRWQNRATTNIQRNYLVRPLASTGAKYETLTDVSRTDGETTKQFLVELPEADQAYEWVERMSIGSVGLDELNLKAIQKAFIPWMIVRTIGRLSQPTRRFIRRAHHKTPQSQPLATAQGRSQSTKSRPEGVFDGRR